MNRFILISGLILILGLSSCTKPEEPVKPETRIVIAEFDGIEITKTEFEERFQLPQNFNPQDDLYTLKLELLNTLINEKLILLEAEKMKISVAEEDVRARFVVEFGSQLDTNTEVKENQEQLLKTLKTQMIIDKFIKIKFSDINITENDLQEYYNQHSDEFYEPDEVGVKQIFVYDKAQADVIYEKLKKGEKFEELAKEYNDEPYKETAEEIFIYRKGELPPEFEAVIFKLKKNRYSKVVVSSYGYHIFKLKNKKMARVIKFNEAKDSIKDILTALYIEAHFKEWINVERNKHVIKFNKDFLEE